MEATNLTRRARPGEDHAAEVSGGEHYMRIGELAQEFDVSLRTLRFYEDKGLLRPKRIGSTRLFSRRDRARLKLIMLARKFGFSLREVKQCLDLYRNDNGNLRQYQFALDKAVRQLERLKRQRDDLNEAISGLHAVVSDLRGRTSHQAA